MNIKYQPAIAIAVAFLLQTTVAPHLRIAGVQPDFLLIVVVVYGFLEGPAVGAVCGFFAGMLQDMLLMTTLGINALSKTLLGYVSGMIERNLFSENFVMPMLVIFVATLLNEFIVMALRATLGESISLAVAMRSIIVPAAIYNGVLAGLLYPLLARVLSRQTRTDSRSAELSSSFGPTLQRVRKK